MRPGDAVFLSASVPYRPPWTEGAQRAEIEEAIVSVSRAVFSRGGRLVFGGHPSVSPLIASVAGEYFAPEPGRAVRPAVAFQSRLYEGKLPDETNAMARFGWCDIVWTQSTGERDGSLRLMRDAMLDPAGGGYERCRLGPPVAMVGVGGMEGIRDEAALFLDKGARWDVAGPPRVFLFASGGGAAAWLLDPARSLERMWPDGRVEPGALGHLERGRAGGRVIDVERAWWGQQRALRREEVALQPYAAIAQWVLDGLRT